MKRTRGLEDALRYRFGEFVLSPATRTLSRDGRVIGLIPRYFDLLRLLVERRAEAVHRDLIRDMVWSDVVVSDGALSQAVRTLRRALDDDAREPRYIRTVSRHGYQFVFPDVIEEPENASPPPTGPTAAASGTEAPSADSFEGAIERLLAPDELEAENGDGEREAALTLHQLGTQEALLRLDRRAGHERARALMRDTRWEVAGSGRVPLFGAPGFLAVITHLARIRLREARRLVALRAASAAFGGALAGFASGVIGASAIVLAPSSQASPGVILALAMLGFLAGGFGAAGIGAGLTIAEALVRSARSAALIVLGAAFGGLTGAFAHFVAEVLLEGFFGRRPSPMGGGIEGMLIGMAAGVGYALTTRLESGGMATPHGIGRMRAALVTGLCCAMAGVLLAASGCHMGAMSLDVLARSFPGSRFSLEPLALLLGESQPGLITRLAISAGEGLFFGLGLASGLTHRPR